MKSKTSCTLWIICKSVITKICPNRAKNGRPFLTKRKWIDESDLIRYVLNSIRLGWADICKCQLQSCKTLAHGNLPPNFWVSMFIAPVFFTFACFSRCNVPLSLQPHNSDWNWKFDRKLFQVGVKFMTFFSSSVFRSNPKLTWQFKNCDTD